MGTFISGSVASDRLLHFSMWAAQALLASFFAAMACLKLLLQPARLVEVMAWSASVPLGLVRALGVCELLAAIAIAAPAVTRAPQRVVGWSATFFAALMASAAIVHIARGEPRMVVVNVLVLALATFVAWGRLTHDPLETANSR